MKLAFFDEFRLGVVRGEEIVDVSAVIAEIPRAHPHDVLRAGTFVIVADPADVAIRIYRACGFTDFQRQLSFERPAPAEAWS